MHALFHGVAVVPVLTIEREEDAVPLACALFEGGLRLIEVTLRTPAALVAIAAIGRELPQIVVGAGTVQRPADVVQACAAGARFLVSPGMTAELAAAALATELPYLPGVATPSEVMTARDLGIIFSSCSRPKRSGASGCCGPSPRSSRASHSARQVASMSARRESIWPCRTCRWSAGHGWRRRRPSQRVIGRECAG